MTSLDTYLISPSLPTTGRDERREHPHLVTSSHRGDSEEERPVEGGSRKDYHEGLEGNVLLTLQSSHTCRTSRPGPRETAQQFEILLVIWQRVQVRFLIYTRWLTTTYTHTHIQFQGILSPSSGTRYIHIWCKYIHAGKTQILRK